MNGTSFLCMLLALDNSKYFRVRAWVKFYYHHLSRIFLLAVLHCIVNHQMMYSNDRYCIRSIIKYVAIVLYNYFYDSTASMKFEEKSGKDI